MIYKILIVLFLFSACDKPAGGNIIDDKNGDQVENQDSVGENSTPITDPDEDGEPEPVEPIDTLSTDKYLLYIGTYTDGGSKGIYVSPFDIETGFISEPTLAATLSNPSFQTITADKKQLWSVSELWNGGGRVYGYEINWENGELKQVSNLSTLGNGPCYVSVHENTKNILTANYGSGNVSNTPVDEMGKSTGDSFTHQHLGKGPHASRQKEPHAHSIKVDLKGIYSYAANLGTDKVYAYTIENNKLTLKKEITIEPGSGPRHLDFHPSMKAMAVVNELNSTISLFKADRDGCFSELYSSITTLPDNFTSNNQCADIHYSPDGMFLYASNRGHNSIVVYKVDQATMALEIVDWFSETINWPRNFTIDPTGNFIIVANQNANSITVLKRDAANGKLTYTGHRLTVSKPVCVTLLKLNNSL
jgi:6-phosphogluconolactonase